MALAKTDNAGGAVNNVETLQEELRFSKRLNYITNKINSSNDIDDILLNLMDSVLSLFDAERLTIYVVDEASKELISRLKTGNEIVR